VHAHDGGEGPAMEVLKSLKRGFDDYCDLGLSELDTWHGQRVRLIELQPSLLIPSINTEEEGI